MEFDNINDELLDCAKDADIERAKAVLAQGADVNTHDDAPGWTPIVHAAIHGHLEMVKWLLANGAQVDSQTQDFKCSTTALNGASAFGHVMVMECLLNHGADIEFKENNGSPLMYAAACEDGVEAVRLLIKRGANVFYKNDGGYSALDWAVNRENMDTVEFLQEVIKMKTENDALDALILNQSTFPKMEF